MPSYLGSTLDIVCGACACFDTSKYSIANCAIYNSIVSLNKTSFKNQHGLVKIKDSVNQGFESLFSFLLCSNFMLYSLKFAELHQQSYKIFSL